MYSKKHPFKQPVSVAFPQRKKRRSRIGNSSPDVPMRSPTSKPSPDLFSVLENDRTLISRDAESNNEWTDEEPVADDAYFHWEEEATLFSDLLDEAAPESGDTNLIALAESLQKPFDQESRQLKKDIARTFVPVVNRIKETFSSIEQTVEAPSAAGLLVFNDASREVENSIGLHDRMVQKAQTEYRARVAELLGQLEEEYVRREQLWVDFDEAMNELVNPVLEMLNEAPAKMERTIASIEKQSRVLEKEGASVNASATEMTLRDLLSKLK